MSFERLMTPGTIGRMTVKNRIFAMPVGAPIALTCGISYLEFGVIMVINTSVGQLTPPMALCLYVSQQVSGCKMEMLCKRILPYLAIESVFVILLTYVPQLISWLPSTMY